MKYHLIISSKDPKGIFSIKVEGAPTPKDGPFLTFLQQRGIRLAETISIPTKHSYDAFKALAASGELYYKERQVLIDLYGKSSLVYRVQQGPVVFGEVHTNGKVTPLSEIVASGALGAGNPHWFIQGIALRFFQTEIRWSDLFQLAYSPETITTKQLQSIIDDDDSNAPKVIFDKNTQLTIEVAANPLPVLKLHDRTGAFADLWFDYRQGSDSLVPAHDHTIHGIHKRDFVVEGEWEKDLLETGFQKKTVGRSHYFCPMDKVAKTLSFLLELGWRLQDSQNCDVVKQRQQKDFHAESCGEVIHINGKFDFGDYEADLKDVYGAFTRRERFIELGNNHVGLLEENSFAGLEADAITEEGLEVRRSSLAAMKGVFENFNQITLDAPLQRLREHLSGLPSETVVSIPPEFKGVLRPYQLQGVEWLQRLTQLGLHGLLADDMGLGKTVQVIAFLSTRQTGKPTLIVVPTTLIFNWVKEFECFLPKRRLQIHQGASRTKDPLVLSEAEIVIATYATVRIDLPLFKQVQWAHLILDEAQAIKNNQTQTAQALCALQADFKLSMTGTPIENRFSELWSHFRFLIPDLFDALQKFEADAAMDSRTIKRKVQPFILRRKKSEVALDLPEKIEQVVWVELGETQRSLYENFLSQIKGNVNKKSTMEVLEAILRLRQLCCHPMLMSSLLDADASLESAKFAALFADLETLLSENQKVLVYSQFTTMLALMTKEAQQRGWKFSVLDGSTKDRESQVSNFQENPEIPLFFISLKAGGSGLNLTAADAVLIYDPWWNEAVERQAIDRAHRMGRSSPVLAKRYIVRESVEEKIMKIKLSKNSIANDVLDEELSTLRLSAEDLEFLLF